MAKFRNPMNGYVQTVDKSSAFWSCLLFGVFYLAYKGAWKHAAIATGAALCTAGLSWFVYPFFAYDCIVGSYLERGWQMVGQPTRQAGSASRPSGPSFDGIEI